MTTTHPGAAVTTTAAPPRALRLNLNPADHAAALRSGLLDLIERAAAAAWRAGYQAGHTDNETTRRAIRAAGQAIRAEYGGHDDLTIRLVDEPATEPEAATWQTIERDPDGQIQRVLEQRYVTAPG